MAKPAVPPTIRFAMRFLKADGTAFGQTSYQLNWGTAAALTGQTDANGWVDADLDGRYSHGTIRFGEGDPEKPSFVERVIVPLFRMMPPAPPPRHRSKDDLLKPKKNDPPPPSAPPPDPPPPRPSPDLIASPQAAPASRDFDPAGRSPPPRPFTHDPPKPSPQLLDVLDRLALGYHMKLVHVFEMVWKLHNLGFLAWTTQPTFPIEETDHKKLLDGLARYTFKYGLTPIVPSDLTGPEDTLSEVWDHLAKTHDAVP
jgi:hypothetical protein